MSTLTIQLDDEAAQLAAEAARLTNQPLEHWLREVVRDVASRAVHAAQPATRRISPLHPGAMVPAADFNSPLEEFDSYR